MADDKSKKFAEKTGEIAGKAAKDVNEVTQSFIKGIKRGFRKKEEEKKE